MASSGKLILTDRFQKGFVLAFELHRRQNRKGTDIPYISHLVAVASLVLEDGGDEDEAIAALLHDTVEDQGGRPTSDKIESEFGNRVADIVATRAPIPRPSRSLRGASERKRTSRVYPKRHGLKCCAFPRQTSCTTHDASSPTTAAWENRYGSASIPQKRR